MLSSVQNDKFGIEMSWNTIFITKKGDGAGGWGMGGVAGDGALPYRPLYGLYKYVRTQGCGLLNVLARNRVSDRKWS